MIIEPVSYRDASLRRALSMRKLVLGILLVCSMGICASISVSEVTAPQAKKDYQILPKPGEKIPLGADHYFIYGFDKPPKIGMAIMRVEIFTRAGKRDTSFIVKGDSDMPSMRGAHSAGEKEFSLSAKEVYLLPVRLVMPGDWEVTFSFVRKEKVVFRGAYLFDI
jgi:hypothetical protein